MIAFHDEYYHPGNFIFAISGDIEADVIAEKLEAQMSDWPAQAAVSTPVPSPNHQLEPGLYIVDKPEVNQGRVAIGHLGTTRDNPDRYALMVMNDILGGGGFTARLLTRIRLMRIFVKSVIFTMCCFCLLYTSPSPRDGLLSRMPSSA